MLCKQLDNLIENTTNNISSITHFFLPNMKIHKLDDSYAIFKNSSAQEAEYLSL